MKKFKVLIAICFGLVASFLLVGCNNKQHEHDYSEWESLCESTCVNKGLKYHQCNSCKNIEYQEINQLEHEFSAWDIIVEATCENEGVKIRQCENCDVIKYEKTDKLNHNFNQEIACAKYLKSEATEENKAVYYYSCVCGKIGTQTFEYGEKLKIKHNVTINMNNDKDILTYIIEDGNCVTLPSFEYFISPSQYLEFDCWCKDEQLTQKFDLTTKIESDTTIYAKWKLKNDYMLFQVLSNSMTEFSVGNILIIEKVDYESVKSTIKVGDIITFYAMTNATIDTTIEDAKNSNAKIVTHKVIEEGDGQFAGAYDALYVTKGTANPVNDAYKVYSQLVVGKYIETIESDEMQKYLKYIGSDVDLL